MEVVCEEMVTRTAVTEVPRPINWKEFSARYSTDDVLQHLATSVVGKLSSIFDMPEPPRRPNALQTRLAILCVYLSRLRSQSNEVGATDKKEQGFWRTIRAAYAFDWRKNKQRPAWYVFHPGDVAKLIRFRRKLRPAPTETEPIRITPPPISEVEVPDSTASPSDIVAIVVALLALLGVLIASIYFLGVKSNRW